MFKRISDQDYTVTPFEANKTFKIEEGHEYISTHLGVNYPENYFFEEEGEIKNDEGTFVRNVYNLVNHFYYRSDEPFQKFGIERRDEVDLSYFPTEPLDSIAVLKISRQLFGEKVRPGSFEAYFEFEKDNDVNFTVTDDGNGNLFIEDRQVGNIFYANGLIVLFWKEVYDEEGGDIIPVRPFEKDDIKYENTNFLGHIPNFEYLFTFFDWNVEFDSTVRRYEHEVACTVDPGEFNGVTNPSVIKDNGVAIDYYKGEVTDDDDNQIDFSPFITTIGLYDEFLNLVAVGKLSRPIRKPDDIPITFVVEFDT